MWYPAIVAEIEKELDREDTPIEERAAQYSEEMLGLDVFKDASELPPQDEEKAD